MNYHTLNLYCKKISEDYLHENVIILTIHVNYAKNMQIFQEQQSIDYILHALDIHLGLSFREIRTLAYNLVCCNRIQMLPSWI